MTAAQPPLVDLASPTCPFSASVLASALTSWHSFQCACCEKFCGQSCGRGQTCQLSPLQCRFVNAPRASPSSPTAIALSVVFIVVLWMAVLLGIRQAALKAELDVLAREVRAGRRMRKGEVPRRVEFAAMGLGALFFVVSVWPFVLAARVGRRQARERVRRHQNVQRVLGAVRCRHRPLPTNHAAQYLIPFGEGEDDVIVEVRAPQLSGLSDASSFAGGKQRTSTLSSGSISADEEFWHPEEESIVALALQGLATLRSSASDDDAEDAEGFADDKNALPDEDKVADDSNASPGSPERLLARVKRTVLPVLPVFARQEPDGGAATETRWVIPMETRFIIPDEDYDIL